MMRMRSCLILFAGGVICLLHATPAAACNVPVYRYALERWKADPYGVVIFHRDPLTAEEQQQADAMQTASADLERPANLRVEVVDVGQPINDAFAADWAASKDKPLPWAVIHAPHLVPDAPPIWAGPLADLTPDVLITSPVRTETARQILDGSSGVWLLLESGDPAQDDAAAKQLAERLAEETSTLKLPSDMADDPAVKTSATSELASLRVDFSMIRVARTDPAETFLIQMLLGSEPDLREIREPLAFPIYGRGRVLYAFAGDGINAEMIHKACAFLVGRCSCEIKDQNPGIDLLMATPWDQALGGRELIRVIDLPPLTGITRDPAAPADTLDNAEASSTAPQDEATTAAPSVAPSPFTLTRIILITMAGVLVVIAVASFAVLRRKSG